MLNLDFIRNEWNKAAGKSNQWDSLSEDEKIEFAIKTTKMVCADICNNLAIESETDDFALDALNEAERQIIEL
ncbi:MAG: hypothetical protein PHH28_10375 [Desulfuromonadaceae bacterium]|nr:hypothetical protein [Desulfuromonadaceae bacterium]